MKKIVAFSPFVALVLIIVLLLCFMLPKNNDTPKEIIITSATLTDTIAKAELSTAKYVHHGIANATIEGTFKGYIMYYALVKPNINFAEVTFDVDDETKTITAAIPENFDFDVELLTDKGIHVSPKKDLSIKEVSYLCETDAQKKAQENTELIKAARENAESSIKMILSPLLQAGGYTLVFK